MGPNAMRGLGLGIAAAGETIGRTMTEEVRAKREAEREAAREASLERRWKAELSARQEERKSDRVFQSTERAADRTAQSADRAADRALQQNAEKGRNSRMDKQLNLQERYQLTKELSDVQQQVASRLTNINRVTADRLTDVRENFTGDALLAQEKVIRDEYTQAFEQARSMGEAQQKQVLNAYGPLGKTVAESASFMAGDIESLKADLGVSEPPAKDDKPKVETVDPTAGRTVKDPNSASGLFGQGFDVGAGAAGANGLPGVSEFDTKLSEGDYSVAGKALGRAGVLTGKLLGDAKDLTSAAYGGLFWSPSEQKAYEQQRQQRQQK